MTRLSIPGKLAILRENVRLLGEVPQDTLVLFLSDFRNLQATLHLLQVSIQILVDLAGYACAERGLVGSGTSLGLIEALEVAKHLPPGSVARFAPVIGFRNRVVHVYDTVDPQITWMVLQRHASELTGLADELVRAAGTLD